MRYWNRWQSTAFVVLSHTVFGVATGHAGEEIVFDRSCATVADRAIVVPSEHFRSSVEGLALGFVHEMAARKKLARLTMSVSRDGLARAMFKNHSHPTYDSTVGEIQTLSLPDLPVARVLIFDGSAVLSYCDQRGCMDRVIVGAANHIALREGNVGFEILHFVLTEPGPALRPSDYSLIVFMRASPKVSISACAAVTKTMSDLTKLDMLQVDVRPDVFFLTSVDFPVVFPFRTGHVLPTKAEFELAPYATCAVNKKDGVRCSGAGFRP